MFKIKALLLIFIFINLKAALPPGTCEKQGLIPITAEGLEGGQCVNKKNLNEALHYLNVDLDLKNLSKEITGPELVRACNEYNKLNLCDGIEEFLHLKDINALPENKCRVLEAACKILNEGVSPAGPKVCKEPRCPIHNPNCKKDEYIIIDKPNINCQKPLLDGSCKVYRECPKYKIKI